MKAPARLALYGAGLAVAFGAAYGLAGVLVPDDVVAAWVEQNEETGHGDDHGSAPDGTSELSPDAGA
ncbi:hypothetical protein CZ771_12125 [Actinomycetales bacterium JB111]|nr:hypothetical protein CZ771_12125 [Actinomycetales bacterium JB111]